MVCDRPALQMLICSLALPTLGAGEGGTGEPTGNVILQMPLEFESSRSELVCLSKYEVGRAKVPGGDP